LEDNKINNTTGGSMKITEVLEHITFILLLCILIYSLKYADKIDSLIISLK